MRDDEAMKAPLPASADLERICKGLAALDVIACEDWESRCYSFNAKWNAKRKERMASMRNGSGDDWFIVFAPHGTFVKSFWHEYRRQDVKAIYRDAPKAVAHNLREPAFSMDDVTYGGWHDGASWTLRGNAKPMKGELTMLAGAAKTYCAYAAECFELKLPHAAVAHVLAGKPLNARLLAQLKAERSLGALKADLAEIAYGK